MNSLNRNELLKLNEDFGTRFYHTLTGMYATGLLFAHPFLKGSLVKELDLNGLLKAELSNSDLEEVKIIYNKNSLDFPLL